MKWGVAVFWLALIAAAVFLPPVLPPLRTEVRCLHPDGSDLPCAPAFARVTVPERTAARPGALLEDLGYAVAEAGPEGCAWLIAGLALGTMFLGLWTSVRSALRRGVLVFALGLPACLGLLYHSCFLEGRRIVLGPEAADEVPCSLHTQTHRTTGILAPRHLVLWHAERGFRVVNVSDKDDVSAGPAALQAAVLRHRAPLVIVGEEWHGSPHVLLVNVRRAWDPRDTPLEDMVAGVHADRGAAFVAHPWSHLPPKRSVDDFLTLGMDGIEAVNGVILGSDAVLAVTRARGKALVGTIDYKFGPHVTAMTLLPASVVLGPGGDPTAEGVVEALRTAQSKVLYAVPGGARTGEAYRAGQLGLVPAKAALRTLLEVPLGRRGVWFAWLLLLAALWWIATRDPRSDPGARVMSPRLGRILFLSCAVLEMALPVLMHWEVKRLLVVPVPVILAAAAVLAVPLLASTVVLSRAEREA